MLKICAVIMTTATFAGLLIADPTELGVTPGQLMAHGGNSSTSIVAAVADNTQDASRIATLRRYVSNVSLQRHRSVLAKRRMHRGVERFASAI